MDYAQNRKAFGQPISQFQVAQAQLVDMGTRIAAVQSLVLPDSQTVDAAISGPRDLPYRSCWRPAGL